MDYTPPAAPPPVKYQKLACGYFSELTLYYSCGQFLLKMTNDLRLFLFG